MLLYELFSPKHRRVRAEFTEAYQEYMNNSGGLVVSWKKNKTSIFLTSARTGYYTTTSLEDKLSSHTPQRVHHCSYKSVGINSEFDFIFKNSEYSLNSKEKPDVMFAILRQTNYSKTHSIAESLTERLREVNFLVNYLTEGLKPRKFEDKDSIMGFGVEISSIFKGRRDTWMNSGDYDPDDVIDLVLSGRVNESNLEWMKELVRSKFPLSFLYDLEEKDNESLQLYAVTPRVIVDELLQKPPGFLESGYAEELNKTPELTGWLLYQRSLHD